MNNLLDKALSTNSFYETPEQKKARVFEIETIFKTKPLFSSEWEALKDEKIELIKQLLTDWKTLKNNSLSNT